MKHYFIYTLLLLVAGCASVQTNYDYDKTANFSNFKTYDLDKHVTDVKIQQLTKDKILAAIENEMQARGYTKTSDNPDLLVDIHTKVQEEKSATATTMGGGGLGFGGWGYGFGGGFSTTNIDVNNYEEGTLFINVINRSTEKIIWQGRGTKTLDENVSPEKKEENINKGIASIFKNYPVKAPGQK